MNYPGSDRIKCVFCDEYIPPECRRCPYCGNLLEKAEEELNTVGINTESTVEYAEYGQNNGNIENALEYAKNRQNGENIESTSEDSENEPKSENIDTASEDAVFEGNNENIEQGNENMKFALKTDTHQSAEIRKKPLSNGMKVFLTTLCVFVPCLGQLIGVIASILFINSDDADRRSFGSALLVSSLIVFVVSVIFSFMLVLILAVLLGGYRG